MQAISPLGFIACLSALAMPSGRRVHPKCLDLILIYLSGPMISIGNLRLVKRASVAAL
jgi:hypothetical protein